MVDSDQRAGPTFVWATVLAALPLALIGISVSEAVCTARSTVFRLEMPLTLEDKCLPIFKLQSIWGMGTIIGKCRLRRMLFRRTSAIFNSSASSFKPASLCGSSAKSSRELSDVSGDDIADEAPSFSSLDH